MARRSKGLTQVGPLPPPVYGMAAVNGAMAQLFLLQTGGHLIIDTRAESLDRGLGARLGRLPRVLAGWFRFLLQGAQRGSLYFSVSGGSGQIYEIGFALLARLKHQRIVLHHHSFAYLTQRRRLMAVLAVIAGPSATHVALSGMMLERLKRLYPVVSKGVVVSNAAFLVPERQVEPRALPRCYLTVGFLGNLCEEKGVFDFLAVLAEFQGRGTLVRGVLAGPFQDLETERSVRSALALLDNVEYRGRVDDERKRAFFLEIDVLLFPSWYVNEAEPLVVLEAMMNGVPVIGSARGAVPELLGDGAGQVVELKEQFVASAVSCIDDWEADPGAWMAASSAAVVGFQRLREDSLRQLGELAAGLLGEDS